MGGVSSGHVRSEMAVRGRRIHNLEFSGGAQAGDINLGVITDTE